MVQWCNHGVYVVFMWLFELVQWCFECVCRVVRVCSKGVPVWFHGGSSVVPVWFQCGSRVVPGWFQGGSRVVPHRYQSLPLLVLRGLACLPIGTYVVLVRNW